MRQIMGLSQMEWVSWLGVWFFSFARGLLYVTSFLTYLTYYFLKDSQLVRWVRRGKVPPYPTAIWLVG